MDTETGKACGDNRFEIIEEAKHRLLESTNIESSPKEMEVLDDILRKPAPNAGKTMESRPFPTRTDQRPRKRIFS